MEFMEERRDGSSDSPSTEQPETPGERCERCGRPIDTGEWYPITKDRDPDGSLRLYAFCSDGCRADWLDEQPD